MIRDSAAGRVTEIPCDPQFIYHYVHVAEALAAALEAKMPPVREYNGSSRNSGL
jgi:UDP-glucuronate 4-epimerase